MQQHVVDGKAGLLAHINACLCRCASLSPCGGCGNACAYASPCRCRRFASPPSGAASGPCAQCCTRTPRSHMRSSLALCEQDHPTLQHMLHGKAGLLAHIHACLCWCRPLSPRGGCGNACNCGYCHAAAERASRSVPRICHKRFACIFLSSVTHKACSAS